MTQRKEQPSVRLKNPRRRQGALRIQKTHPGAIEFDHPILQMKIASVERNKQFLLHKLRTWGFYNQVSKCFFFQSSFEEELCGSDGVDRHDLHQQSGQIKAGTHQRGAGAHGRVQTGPSEEFCQRSVLVLRVRLARFTSSHLCVCVFIDLIIMPKNAESSQ